MLTRVERQALRDRLAPVRLEWGPIRWDPPSQSGEVEIGGLIYRADIREVDQPFYRGSWTWVVSRVTPLESEHVLARSPKPVFCHAEAMDAAEAWLTSHLHPDREAILALLDWADAGDVAVSMSPNPHPDSPPPVPGFAELSVAAILARAVEVAREFESTVAEHARESRAAETLQAIRQWFEDALMRTRPWLSWDIGVDGPYPPTRPFAISVETPMVGYGSIREGAMLLGIEAPEWGEAYAWVKAGMELRKEATRPQALEWAREREAEEESQ